MRAQRIGTPASVPVIAPAPPSAPAAVVAHMLAVQAQDLPHSLWAVGVRATGTTVDDVRAAYDRAEIVRSWPMRGTLHAIRPDDLRMLLSLTAERTIRQTTLRREQLGLTDEVVDRARDRVVAVLEREHALSRDALLADLREGGIDTSAGRGSHLLLHLSVEGRIAWGPTDGRGQAVVLLDEWAPAATEVPDREESLRRAFEGYLRGRGPATLRDFATWLKLPLGDARIALAAAGEAVREADGDHYALADAAPSADPGVGPAHLLPGFDEYLLGYADRSAQLDRTFEQHVVPGGNGIFFPMAVVRGRVVGTWRRAAAIVRVTPFVPLSDAARSSLVAAARRYGAFLGTRVALEVTDPVGA